MSNKKQKYIYCGCFVDPIALYPRIRNLFPNGLDKQIQHPHVTLAWRPIRYYKELFGKEVQIKVIAYGNNGKNEGVRVKLVSNNRKIQRLIQERTSLHITLSVADGAAPSDTCALMFTNLDKPFTITGIFGGYRDDHTVDTGSVSLCHGPAIDSHVTIEPLEAFVNGKDIISASSLTVLKRKASRIANNDFNPIDRMVVTFTNDKGSKQSVEFIRRNRIYPDNTIRRGTWN